MGRTVLIVDDHAPFRRAARELLTIEGYDVVGEAADGRSGVAEAQRLSPEIVLLDVQLPDIDGFEVARLLQTSGSTSVTVLVSGRTGNYQGRVAESPAAAFILKGDLTGAALAGVIG